MENNQKKTSKILGIFVIILLFIAFGAIIHYFQKSNNPVLVDNAQQTTEILRLRDSLLILKQVVLVSNTRSLTKDSLLIEAIKIGRVKPETIIQWKNQTSNPSRDIQMKDSFNSKIEDILRIQRENLSLSASITEKESLALRLEREKNILLATRIPFKDSTKHRYLEGTVGLNSKLSIDKDIVVNEPYVIFGEQKGFLKRPVITALVGDKNPATKQDSLYSATYKPKQKMQFSLGPQIMSNGKTLTAGAGVNLKKGIFSVSLGYTLYNSKF